MSGGATEDDLWCGAVGLQIINGLFLRIYNVAYLTDPWDLDERDDLLEEFLDP